MPEQACDILVLTSYAALEGAAAPFVEEYGARYQVKMTPYQSLYRSDEAITASVDPSAKVIIPRGYPATACRRLTDKHVVELSISFQDVLSALDRVLRPDTVRAAVIVYDNMLSGERSMVRLGGLELYFLTLTQFTRNRDKELIVDFLRRNRIQAAVGSALAGEAAGQCGVPFGIIASGERSIARAFEEAAALLVQEGWTVARTERYVEEVLQTEAPKEKKNRRPLLIRDIRFFLNSLDHSLAVMRSAGVDAKCHRAEEGEDLLLTIRIPRARPPAG